jgi:hypothetical protein
MNVHFRTKGNHKEHNDLHKDHNTYFIVNFVPSLCTWWFNVIALNCIQYFESIVLLYIPGRSVFGVLHRYLQFL